jgi:type VI secretion system protein ImpH
MLSPQDHFAKHPYDFDFFQAVRILERIDPQSRPVGLESTGKPEVVRFRSHLSLAFPPSAILTLEGPDEFRAPPLMTVTFMGLYGTNGVLPTHYTQLLMELQRDVRGPERRSLRDWFDLFNHRIISLFYRAWEKYRFHIPYERGEAFRSEPDAFTLAMRSLVGLGTSHLRQRQRVFVPVVPHSFDEPAEQTLAQIDDLALLYYAGLFVQRPRNATNLQAILADYFRVPVEVQQFQGQWLPIPESNQTQLGVFGTLGVSAVAGSRVWDRQSRFRIRLGPLNYRRFEDLIPDRQAVQERKTFFLVVHLTRLFVGPEFDFDIQLVLDANQVPPAQLSEGLGAGPRLGWNLWLTSGPLDHDADDATFDAEWVSRLDP